MKNQIIITKLLIIAICLHLSVHDGIANNHDWPIDIRMIDYQQPLSCNLVPKSSETCSCQTKQITQNQFDIHQFEIPSHVLETLIAGIWPKFSPTPQMCLKQVQGQLDDEFPWMLFYPAMRNRTPGWVRIPGGIAYYFDTVIRIGDDKNYQVDNLCYPSAYTTRYSATFNLPENIHFHEAFIHYWITGSSQANQFYVNNVHVGDTCSTDNQYHVCGVGRDIPITLVIHTGENTFLLKLVKYPGDDYLPYDDIEIYKLQIQLLW